MSDSESLLKPTKSESASPTGNPPSETDDPGPEGQTVRSGSKLDLVRQRVDPSTGLPVEGSRVNATRAEAFLLPRAGDVIDTFELVESIGAGGMGAVFRAHDSRLDRQVALKVLPIEQASDPEVVQRFYQEGRAAARLDHENIARVYTIGYDGRFHYIAFEFIEGITLKQRVERSGPLSVEDAIHYTLQIAEALVHSSSRNVVHRDIKPSNIIVTPQGRVKLVDMGLARHFERGGDDGLTQSGMTLGTFDYISPEQARDPRDVDVRSDLYSLGCTIFHMLTGRPPFPGGTVIQKLIQHQEEPPPDVRAINPAVPDDLAAAIVRLMAKDRDRRYQSPEKLVRDLTASDVAIASRSVEGGKPTLMASPHPPRRWERHLVWILPPALLVFLVLLIFLEGERHDATSSPIDPGAKSGFVSTGVPGEPGRSEGILSGLRVDSPGKEPVGIRDGSPRSGSSTTPLDASPRQITVDSTGNLLEVLGSARKGDVIILSDDGPFFVDPGHGAPAVGLDVTIKAANGAHPVIELEPRSRAGGPTPEAILAFHGGRVVVEGLEFVADSDEFSDAPSVLLARGTEMTIRGCVFRHNRPPLGLDDLPQPPSNAAILVRTLSGGVADAERPPIILVERSHFGGGQIGVLARGRADIVIRDCTFAAPEPIVWLDNASAPSLVPTDLAMRHVSAVAGIGPLLRFEGAAPRVWADDCVFAAIPGSEATLVETDLVESLTWRGRGNLYSRIGAYLRTTGGRGQGVVLALSDPRQWSGDRVGLLETGAIYNAETVWADPNPLQRIEAEPENPARAFRLAARTEIGFEQVGARHGPFGDIPAPSRTLVASRDHDARPLVGPVPPRPANRPGGEESALSTTPTNSAPPKRDDPDRDLSATDGLPEMPVMPPGPPRGAQSIPRAESVDGIDATVTTNIQPPNDSTIAPTPRAFSEAIRSMGDQGGVIRVPADADWELTQLRLSSKGRIRIEAEVGRSRPRLRFRPPAPGVMLAPNWMTLFELVAGSMTIQGVDLVLDADLAPPQGRWAVLSVAPGVDARLSDCTITIEGSTIDSAAIVASDADPGNNAAGATAATIELVDSLVRVAEDAIDISSSRRVGVDANNVVFSTGGCLIHAHGLPRGRMTEKLGVKLTRISARATGGVILLESAAGEPELLQAEVKAVDSIFATDARDGPMLRVDTQERLDAIRDKIDWEGHGNGYHQISTYRRDQTAQVGIMPNLFNRPSWTVALGDRETEPVHGDLRFARDWDAANEPWTLSLDDMRLADDSPARSAGANLDRLPTPPSTSR